MRVSEHRVGGLLTRVTGPDGPPASAHLVLRTPYDSAALLPEAAGWAARGIGTVLQDVRGRHGSPGRFSPFRGEDVDGARLVGWVRDRIGGPVVLYGPSYSAHCAVSAHALEPADALAVLVPACGLAETARTVDGAFELAHRIGWWRTHTGARRSRHPRPLDPATLTAMAALPPEEVGDRLGLPQPEWRSLVAARRDPAARDVGWAALAPVPLLVLGGTRDWFAADARDLAAAWPGPTRLVLGPWDHSLQGAARASRLQGWLDRVLAGDPPHDVVLLDDADAIGDRPVDPAALDGTTSAPGCDPTLASWAPRTDLRRERPAVALGGLPAVLHGDLTVHLDAVTDRADADWVVDLVRVTPRGAVSLAHAAGPTPVLRLGPVLARSRPDAPLELRIAAGDVPRHPRPADTGRPRRLYTVRLGRTS